MIYITINRFKFKIFTDQPQVSPSKVSAQQRVTYSVSSSKGGPTKSGIVKPAYEQVPPISQEHHHHTKGHKNHDSHTTPVSEPIKEPDQNAIKEAASRSSRTYSSPADYYRNRGSYSPAKTNPQTKGGKVTVGKSVTYQYTKNANKPVIVNPNQYRDIYRPNYQPAGKYTRCVCE